MKKASFLSVALLAATFTLFGCGDDRAEYAINWDGDNSGTLEVNNTSAEDVVLFIGQVPTSNNILGGARASKTTLVNICKFVPDCNVGGYAIVRGITREEYNNNELDITNAKVEFNAMATYKSDEKYRITINRNYMGNNAFKATNVSNVGIELRKDSPDGEKIAYLAPLKQNQMVYAASTDNITLFPVYVFYNTSTQTINTLNSTSMFDAITVGPRPATGDNITNIKFPNDPDASWDKIVGTIKSPVAYIKFSSGIIGQAAYFTNARGTRLKSQEGYDGANSGEILTFELKADDDGIPMNLLVEVYGGVIEIPVLFEGELTPPVIKNGYDYTVSATGSGQDASKYTAVIKEVGKRDLSSYIVTAPTPPLEEL